MVSIPCSSNIRIDVASEIAPPLRDASVHDHLSNRNTNSMFLSPTNEEEIISIIRTCNNKTSTDIEQLTTADVTTNKMW